MKNNVHTNKNIYAIQRRIGFVSMLVALLLFLAYSQAQAQGCVSNAEYSLFGSAKLDAVSGEIILTPEAANQAGQAWSKRVIDLRQPFYQRFYVYLGTRTAFADGGDGFAFVLRGMTNQTTGTSGLGLGYQGITPSLALEFDTYANSGDISNDHLALHRNGDPTTTGRIGSNVDVGNIEDGQFHLVYVNWDPYAQLFTVDLDGVEKIRITRDIIKLDFGGNPNVIPGYTASTGGAFNEQKVCIEEMQYTPYNCQGNGEYLLTGHATMQNESMVLTPDAGSRAGQAWSKKTIDLTRDFTQMFDINLGDDATGGDGFAFLLRGNTTQVSGTTGAGLGYHGITPSLAFEFDSYSNTDRGDIANDHFALHRNGNSYTTGRIGNNVDLGSLKNGVSRAVIIDWKASTQTITVTIDGEVKYTVVRDIVALDFGGNPYVTLGFTASTGLYYNLQNVCIGNLIYTPFVVQASAISATCTGSTANSNAILKLDNYGNATKVGYSIGNIYTGPDFSAATTLTAAPYTVVSNLPNPTVNQPYTIRTFSTASIYTDKTVILSPITCATADLSLTVTTSVQTANKGETLTYTFTATNNGPSDVTDAIADIDIPSNVTLLNATPSQGTYSTFTRKWAIGAIANGGSKTLKIDVKVN